MSTEKAERATRCPTCGSSDPKKYNWHFLCADSGTRDPWHDPAPVVTPPMPQTAESRLIEFLGVSWKRQNSALTVHLYSPEFKLESLNPADPSYRAHFAMDDAWGKLVKLFAETAPVTAAKPCEYCEQHLDRIFGNGEWIHVDHHGGGTHECSNQSYPPPCPFCGELLTVQPSALTDGPPAMFCKNDKCAAVAPVPTAAKPEPDCMFCRHSFSLHDADPIHECHVIDDEEACGCKAFMWPHETKHRVAPVSAEPTPTIPTDVYGLYLYGLEPHVGTEQAPKDATEFAKTWEGFKGPPSLITPGKTVDPLADWQKAVAVRFAEAYAAYKTRGAEPTAPTDAPMLPKDVYGVYLYGLDVHVETDAEEFAKTWEGFKGPPSLITPGKTVDPLTDWQKDIAVRFADAFAASLRERVATLEKHNAEFVSTVNGLDDDRDVLLKENSDLRGEIATLRKALGEREKNLTEASDVMHEVICILAGVTTGNNQARAIRKLTEAKVKAGAALSESKP